MDSWFKFDVEKFQKELEKYERSRSLQGVSTSRQDTQGRSQVSSREDRVFGSDRTADKITTT